MSVKELLENNVVGGGRSEDGVKIIKVKRKAFLEALAECDAEGWIPVSDPPKNVATVFVLCEKGAAGIGMYGKDDDGNYGWERLDNSINTHITLWKPIVLPKENKNE